MSTHNIGFYEDLTKIIFELSSDIIKYAPYFFCCTCPSVLVELLEVVVVLVFFTSYEPCSEKTGLQGFLPGHSKARLYSHR